MGLWVSTLCVSLPSTTAAIAAWLCDAMQMRSQPRCACHLDDLAVDVLAFDDHRFRRDAGGGRLVRHGIENRPGLLALPLFVAALELLQEGAAAP